MKENQQFTYDLIKNRKRDALDVLYTRYGKKLFGYARVNWNLDEDACWEVVYKTLEKVIVATPAATFESEEKFGGFVFRIFLNFLRNYYRDARVRRQVDLSNMNELDESKFPLAVYPENDNSENHDQPLMARLKEELENLQDWERMLLLLRSQDYPYSEISRLTGKPADQLKVYYQRLKSRIQQKLNENQEGGQA